MTDTTESIAPFCFGYFTQYWFGVLGPMPNKPTLELVNSHLAVAFSKEVGSGISAVILENGLIRFNFEGYEKGGIFIYRYRMEAGGVSIRQHSSDLESREREVQQFAFRLIQIHAVLLDNARRLVEGCSSHTSRPTSLTGMLPGYDVADPLRKLDPDFKFWIPLPDQVAKRSLDDLAKAVLNEEGLFQLVELYSFSLTHFLERRYAEALILYWAAIEASINVLWDRLLVSEKDAPNIGLSRPRKERLTNSNSITASVMIEALFLLRRIPPEIYQELNNVRKWRNDWIHKLRPINEEAALEARKACENLLYHVFAFEIRGTIGGVGGAGGGLYKAVFCQRYPHKAGLFD